MGRIGCEGRSDNISRNEFANVEGGLRRSGFDERELYRKVCLALEHTSTQTLYVPFIQSVSTMLSLINRSETVSRSCTFSGKILYHRVDVQFLN